MSRTWSNVLLVAGIACIAVGFWRFERPVVFAAEIAPRSEAARELVATLDRVERAAVAGDVGVLRQSLTTRYFAALEREFESIGGRPLDGLALHETGGFLGDLRAMRIVGGVGDGSRAVLVMSAGAGGLVGVELRAFVFDGRDGRARLDDKKAKRLAPGADVDSAALAWARELTDS